ncbi:MAG: hypothetical protein KDC87_02480 [Planctomycetes bacterium]|nr:hypothetical protein [Planctomycetota bacterium]
MRRPVQKLAATQVLEALRDVLAHFQKWSMELELAGVDRPSSLISEFRRVRRLHDALAGQLQGHGPQVDLDVDPTDADLLVSCCLFAAENIESSLVFGSEEAQEQGWAVQHMQNLFRVATDFALSPVKLIEGPGRGKEAMPEVQAVVAEINRSVYLAQQELLARRRAEQTLQSGGDPGFGASAAEQSWSAQVASAVEPRRQYLREANDAQFQRVVTADPARGLVSGGALGEEAFSGAWGGKRNLLPESAHGGTTRASRAAPAVTPQSPAAQPRQEPEPSQVPVDPRRVQDPRLRSALVLDLKALQRSWAAEDFRMSAVHVSSVFEAVVTDYALPRRAELDLRGTPDTWQLQKIVTHVLGPRITSPDRNALYHLVAARNLVRPSVQLVNPIVVTRQSVEKMMELTRRFAEAVSGSAT